jgi:hypothetical protein
VTCAEFNEAISAAVDERLLPEDMALFLEHAEQCRPCRCEFEGERTVAGLIRARMKPACAPPEVVAAVLRSIVRESRLSESLQQPFMVRLWHHRLTRPAIAFVLSFAVITILLNRSEPPSSGFTAAGVAGDDLIGESVANFRAVTRGEMKPQILSDRPEDLRSFFEGKTEFPVLVPSMKECTLVGGVVNDFHGLRVAHVVYRHGTQMIYLSQTCRETVMKREPRIISQEVKSDLDSTGWYRHTIPGGATVVLWAHGNTLCAAVAEMQEEGLMSQLQSADSEAR